MRLAVFTKNRSNPAYAAARVGAERTAARLNASVVHYVPQQADDIDEQIALIDEALREKFDAFVLVPVHMSAVDDAVARVMAARIPIVTCINRLDRGDFVSFVGADDGLIGRDVATYLAQHLGGRGRVVILEGMPGSVTNVDRMQGFAQALSAFAHIRIVATLQGEYQQVAAREAMQAYLAASQPAFDAVLAANDSMALGALEALAERGLKSVVAGINAVPQAIAAIKRGELLATADFDAMKISCIATEAAIRHLRGESVPHEIILPVQIVDLSNCMAWDQPIEARACPQWDEVIAGK
ncbi:MAG: sugar ABC transporter substrate-binding protein [Pseudomonadota bacterium]